MKKQITFFRTVALLLSIMLGNISVMALSFEYGELSYSTTRNGVYVTGFAKNATVPTTLVIPDAVTYQGTTYPVEQIGISGFTSSLGIFSANSTIKKVVVGSNVELIATRAFLYCSNLTSVDMTRANRLETIESMAFYGCPISTLTLPDNIDLANIAPGAFVYSGNNVGRITTLNVGLNCYCAEPMSIFGNAVRIIKFKGTNNIGGGWGKLPLEEAYFAETSKIGEGTFADCTTLTSVTGLVGADIKARAFANTGLTDVTIEYSKVDTTAFINCKELTTLHLKDTRRDGWSFAGNPVIQKVYLTDCGYIPAEAFRGCYNLEKITSTGTSATTIGDYAFADCTSLNDVYFHDLYAINEGGFRGCSALKDFGSSKFTGLKTVLARAFENCTSLEGYINLSSCTQLGEYIFNNAGTEDLHITIGLAPCRYNTLSGCRAGYLTCNDTRLYNSYTATGNKSPLNGAHFQVLDFPELTEALPTYIFHNMPELQVVKMPKLESATNLNKNFGFCPALSSLEISNSKLRAYGGGVYSNDFKTLYYILPSYTSFQAHLSVTKVYADCADQPSWSGASGSRLSILDLSLCGPVELYNPKGTFNSPSHYVRIPYGKRNDYKTFTAAGMEFITDYIKGDVDEDGKVTIADANAAVNISLGQ